MNRVAVCIPTSTERISYLQELCQSLTKQTFQDFKIFSVVDVKPIGKAKNEVVKMALDENPDYICMIDDDDLVDSTYLEKLVKRMDQGGIDWCFTWGRLFGSRVGYIHGEIEPFEKLIAENHRPSQFMAQADVFRSFNYNTNTTWAEDLELWILLDYFGYKGDVVKEELYFRRWHDKNLSITRHE